MKYYEPFLRFPQFKTRAVTLSFDDGHAEDRQMVEILDRYRIKCTFNLTAGRIDENPKMVQFHEFENLYRNHEIAAHSFTHPHLGSLDAGGISYQIIKDRERLEEATGQIIQGFAYPYGLRDHAEEVINCLSACGIMYGRTTNATRNFELPTDYLRWNPTCHQADPRLPELAQQFFAPDDAEHPWRIRPLLFYIWGHSYEFKDNWDKLEDICKTVGGKDTVWYATNGEIIEYISAFHALRRSVNGRILHNPTDIDLYIRVDQTNIVLEKGKTIAIDSTHLDFSH